MRKDEVMPTDRTWRHVLTASIALLGLLLVVVGVRAQEQPEPNDDPAEHYFYQFYGFARDVTIDGEPLQEGDAITPVLNGEPVKTAMIPENGFFLTFKQDFNLPPIGECNVVFLIDSQRHKEQLRTDEFSYPIGCGDIEVKLALFTTNGNVGSDDASVAADEAESVTDSPTSDDAHELESEQASQAEDMMQSEADEDDMLEESSDSEEALPEAEQSSAVAASDAVPPDTPNLGTGGLKAAESDPRWSVVVGMIVLIVSAVACALMMMRRRKDQSPH